MTRLEALQSLVEYENTNLLAKVLIDMDVVSTATYTSADAEDIELASAYVYQTLAMSPDYSEGSLRIGWDRPRLKTEASRIFAKYGVDQIGAVIDGSSKW
jgi:hypothetical protein